MNPLLLAPLLLVEDTEDSVTHTPPGTHTDLGSMFVGTFLVLSIPASLLIALGTFMCVTQAENFTWSGFGIALAVVFGLVAVLSAPIAFVIWGFQDN